MPLLRRFSSGWLLYFVFALSLPCLAVDWPPVAPEELKMTDLPEQKGAAAVILLRDELADDVNNYHSVYMRIKILTDAGKRYADVQIPYGRRYFNIDSVSGRTLHADGSVVNFEGKVFDKMVEREKIGRGEEFRVHVKSFSLPDVQVGSIIDYKFSLRYADNLHSPPEWIVQQDIFQRKAHFKFIPYEGDLLLAHNRVGNGVQWTSYLPTKGPQPKFTRLPVSELTSRHEQQSYVELSMTSIPAVVREPLMPPLSAIRYRVSFYYMVNQNPEDYWRDEGHFWSKDVEKFLDHKDGVSETVGKITAPADPLEQKVRKIYAFVSGLENQSYRRKREQQEQKIIGLKTNEGAADVLRQQSGDHDDLNRLFVAMVRAAGIQAEMMWVASREERLFQPELLNTDQLEAEISIVHLGDKELFLDPGSKYCPYGLLDWRYSAAKGLRQNAAKGTEIAEAPLPDYNQAQIQRLARLQLSEDGKATGTVKIGYYGIEAMDRRQKAGNTDAEGKKKLLEDELRGWLPGDSEVSLVGTPNWDDTEQHLSTEFKVTCPIGVSAGKRLLIPIHIFQVNSKAVFAASERTNSIYFWYRTREIDEVHMAVPSGVEIESLPANDSVKLDYALYSTTQKQDAPGSIVARRDMVMAGVAFPPTEYKELKAFYDKAKTGDDQQMILHGAPHAELK